MSHKDIHLVLIHGFAANKNFWGLFAEHLEKKYTVHRIDLPGYNEQMDISAHSLPEIAHHVLNQINPRSSQTQFIWLGWSLGGLIAYYLAHTVPLVTKGVISLGFNPKFIASDDWPCGVQYSAHYSLEKSFKRHTEKALNAFFNLQGEGLNAAIKKQLLAVKNQSPLPSLETFLRDLHLLATSDLRDIISKLTCPQLNILGVNDSIVPISVLEPLNHLSAYAQNVTIEDAGHVMFLSHATECITLIEQFINESIITQ